MAILPRRFRDPLEEDFIRDAKGNVVDPLYRESLTPGFNPEFEPPAPNVPLAAPAITPREAPLPELDTRMTRTNEYEGGLDAARLKKESRWVTGARGALRGLAQGLASGQGLGAGLGGALGGATGAAIDPKGYREMEFHERTLPRLALQWRIEDRDRAIAGEEWQRQRQAGIDQQNRMLNEAQINELGQRHLPRPTPGPQPKWERGKNRRTGQLTVYNAADPQQNAEHEPLVTEQRGFAPDWVETKDGYVNLNDPKTDPKKVRKLQRPRAAAKPKEEPKVVSMSQLRKAANEAFGGDVSEAEAAFVRKGFRVVGR